MKRPSYIKKSLLFLCVFAVQAIALCQTALAIEVSSPYNAAEETFAWSNYPAYDLNGTNISDTVVAVVLNPDGSVTGIGKDGSKTTMGGKWPSNSLTKTLPVPETHECLVYNEGEDSFTAVWEMTLAECRAYVESLRSRGIDLYSQEIEMYENGDEIYSYYAVSLDGMAIELLFSEDTVAMDVSDLKKIAFGYSGNMLQSNKL